MSIQFIPKNRPRRVLSIVALSALILSVCSSVDARAEHRVQLLNKGRGVASLVEGRTKEKVDLPAAARAQGTFQMSNRSGLTLGGNRVLVSPKTSVFPNLDGMSTVFDERDLAGKSATIYGRVTPEGIKASLIIIQPSEYSIDAMTEVSPEVEAADSKLFVPVETGQPLGEVSEEVPQ